MLLVTKRNLKTGFRIGIKGDIKGAWRDYQTKSESDLWKAKE